MTLLYFLGLTIGFYCFFGVMIIVITRHDASHPRISPKRPNFAP